MEKQSNIRNILVSNERETYFKQCLAFENVVDGIIGDYKPPVISNISRRCFAIVKSDAVASGKCRRLAEFLEKKEFSIDWFQYIDSPHPLFFEELYKFNLTQSNDRNQFGLWWMNTKAHQIGPIVAMLLRDHSSSDLIAAERLSRVKGQSVPFLSDTETLRWELQGTNRTMNLIHVADGAVSTFRELQALLDRETVGCIGHEIETQRLQATSTFELIDYAAGISSDISFYKIYLSLIIKVILSHKYIITNLNKFDEGYLHTLDAIKTDDFFPRRVKFLNTVAILSEVFDGFDMPYIEEMLDIQHLTFQKVEEFLSELKRQGIKVSELDEIVLISSVYYRSDFDRLIRLD